MRVTLADIVAALGGELVGDSSIEIDRIASLESAGVAAIGFVAHPRYRSQLAATRAACVIVGPELAEEAAARGAAIVTPDPYRYYARLSQWWAPHLRPTAGAGIHPSAVVDPSADVAASAHIGARCIVHPGAVIGADGFGFAPHAGGWEKIEQLGGVRIGDDVEIGANTCIDRGALEDTVIEDGVKLDNLVQVGHNVRIGAHSALAGCVGIAGSARIGAHCTFGGGAIVLGHLELADHVAISAATVVTRSIHKPGLYSGVFPIDDNASWEKNAATLRQLHSLRERIRHLEKKTP